MIPLGPNADGAMTYKMTGMFAEVFDNLQVIFKKFYYALDQKH